MEYSDGYMTLAYAGGMQMHLTFRDDTSAPTLLQVVARFLTPDGRTIFVIVPPTPEQLGTQNHKWAFQSYIRCNFDGWACRYFEDALYIIDHRRH